MFARRGHFLKPEKAVPCEIFIGIKSNFCNLEVMIKIATAFSQYILEV
jgi:hypothetical protein